MRKAQAAMEFLMTYGWAILVVLVAIGALAYFGVLSPDKFLPSKCTLPSGIACKDFKVSNANGVTVVVVNSLGQDMNTVSFKAQGCSDSDTEGSIPNGGEATLNVTSCSFSSTTKYSGEINISYTFSDGGLSHITRGSITAKME